MQLRRLSLGAAVLGALLTISGPVAQAQVGVGLPDLVGQWTEPFEEGGAATPRCVPSDENDPDGFIVCKAVAQAAAVLPDGRIVYYNGLEGAENAEQGPIPLGKLPPVSRDSQTRVLDLRSGTPTFTVPAQGRGGQTNENIQDGQSSPGVGGVPQDPDNVFGYLGAPGRPGDGLVGSLAGAAGVPEQQPTSPPDDSAANDGDMFCADVVSLPDGRVMTVGGTDWYNEPAVMDRNNGDPADVGVTELEGLPNTNIFDPRTNTWSPGARMKYGRWYPGLVELEDGKVLVTGGTTKLIKATQLSQVRRTETYDPAADTWTENYIDLGSENSLPQMPRLVLAPNGKVFYAAVGQMWGPFGQAADEATYAPPAVLRPADQAVGDRRPVAPLGARSGAAVVPLPMKAPYDAMTLLTFGGTLGPPPGSWIPATPFSTLTNIKADGTVTNELTGNLNHGRWYSSGVALPDGKVLAVAGADKDEVMDPGTEIPVKVPELYDPATGTWTEVASHTRDRTYHNSALLLPDMRVLLGGHTPLPAHYGGPNQDQGGPFANNDKDSSFEVWSPPYLFRGERPRITQAQAGVAYGETFTIGTPQAGEIESVQLIKTPSPQHIIDSEQRILELPFSATGAGTLEAVAPPTGVAAPPGWYYLVVNRTTPEGPVPSVARMVQVGLGSNPAEALQPFADDAPAPVGGSATPTEDSSTATSTQTELAKATAGTPAQTATDVTADAYQVLSTRPAAATGPPPLTPASLPVLPLAGAGVGATALATGRRWLRHHG